MGGKKIVDARGRLTRLIKYTDGEPKEMIMHYVQQLADIGYKNKRSLLEQKYCSPQSHSMLTERRSNHGYNSNQLMVLPFKNSTIFLSNVKVELISKTWNVLDQPEICIQRRYSRESDFVDLIHFVDNEETLANDLLFSKEALSSEYVIKREVSSTE